MVNSLKLNVYYRMYQFTEDNRHIYLVEAGVEIGEIIFLNDRHI